ncbi:gamma-tubulin complex component 2, partial [Striga asiatica]
ESIRNSADNVLLNTPDSLIVSVTKNVEFSEDEPVNQSVPVSTPRKGRAQSTSMDVLDSLKFTYKACSFGIFVSWPLELIANLEAMKKYNQHEDAIARILGRGIWVVAAEIPTALRVELSRTH